MINSGERPREAGKTGEVPAPRTPASSVFPFLMPPRAWGARNHPPPPASGCLDWLSSRPATRASWRQQAARRSLSRSALSPELCPAPAKARFTRGQLQSILLPPVTNQASKTEVRTNPTREGGAEGGKKERKKNKERERKKAALIIG